MSALSRNKGAAYERRIANQLTEATGTRWRRRVRNHEDDSDVVPDDPAFDRISVECKHATTLCLPKWWRQAQAQAGETHIPVLIYKRTGMVGDLVMLDAYDVNPRTFPVRGALHGHAGLGRSDAMDAGEAARESTLFPGDLLMTALTLSCLPSTPVVEVRPGRLFATAHAALTFAFNHSDQVYDKPMMARMAQAPTEGGKGLGGTDGVGQAAIVFRALEPMPDLYRAVLVARFAPRTAQCKCCQGTVDRHDWLAAVRQISDAAVCDALSAHPTARVLRDAIVARYFGKDVKLSDAADRAGVSAATATNHNGKIKLWLYGTRTTKKKDGGRGDGKKGIEALAMEYAADLLTAKGLCD